MITETKLASAFVGKRVFSIEIDSEQQHYLRFTTDRGTVVLCACGDCCSESWFSQITGIGALVGGTVTSVCEIAMGSIEDGITRQEFDQLYSIKFVTDRGHADIDFRNSSNGYYGGYLDLSALGSEKVVWKLITADYP